MNSATPAKLSNKATPLSLDEPAGEKYHSSKFAIQREIISEDRMSIQALVRITRERKLADPFSRKAARNILIS